MTNKDLIELLQQRPPDARVFVYCGPTLVTPVVIPTHVREYDEDEFAECEKDDPGAREGTVLS